MLLMANKAVKNADGQYKYQELADLKKSLKV